jgi:hypothetical protein
MTQILKTKEAEYDKLSAKKDQGGESESKPSTPKAKK